ncbi:MAG: bifunctional (p)ppGpp synthetase/guanosine-3',5'-bis(diphosphate) 3'-pyrophosphohydrolase [Candidatus Spechtbacteria bacterium]|nr:bifunctional (p)ppGpp synthetase/guanosine-3',5'-bis(diphosphate) 3'-pyrophosphohydrolase [Candidatus Spechtbacteria bacterium]
MSSAKQKTTEIGIEEIKNFFSAKEDKDLIQRAFDKANSAHEGQKRESGDPYIIHPLYAARTLAEMKMDAQTIAAALLHDVVDDTPVTLEEIEKEFGKTVSFLVAGVSKLGKLKYRGAERHAENLRKMIVAMAQDVRVILIKFADRLHNMNTLDALPQHKRERIALETLEIYAPIAIRLGVADLGKKLEDLAFPYMYPEEYAYIKKESKQRLLKAEEYLDRLRPKLKRELGKENIKPKKIEMRSKHYYSLWLKLKRNNNNWDQIMDLMAVRIIVDSVEECYKTLGVIHKLWRPVPGKIKDYIALPKPNGYQSLHTTVFCLDGRRTEFQIRTPEMHENAEYGIAAHWKYKTNEKGSKKNLNKTYGWVRQLQEWKKDTSPSDEFLDNLKIDVFSDRIFVFTPAGDVIDLPAGATPIDFAYNIHSNVGDKCSAAIRNGKMVSLASELHNGDVVEIITSKNKTPSQAWLQFAKTRGARAHIKKWFDKQNREQHMEAGLNIINEELESIEGKNWNTLREATRRRTLEKFSMHNDESLFAAVGRGDISVARVINNLLEESLPQKAPKRHEDKPSVKSVSIAGIGGLKMRMAQCCNPAYPDNIVAYITVGKGASIHKVRCPGLHKKKRTEKILPAYWNEARKGKLIPLTIKTANRVGMLQDISKIIADLNANIVSINASIDKSKTPPLKGGGVSIEADIEIENIQLLRRIIEKIKAIDGVLDVRRRA